MTEKLLLSREEAAEVLGISTGHLLQLVREGRLQAIQVGKVRKYSRAALEAFADGYDSNAPIGIG